MDTSKSLCTSWAHAQELRSQVPGLFITMRLCNDGLEVRSSCSHPTRELESLEHYHIVGWGDLDKAHYIKELLDRQLQEIRRLVKRELGVWS